MTPGSKGQNGHACMHVSDFGTPKHEERSHFTPKQCKMAGVLSVLAAQGPRSVRAACHSWGQNTF